MQLTFVMSDELFEESGSDEVRIVEPVRADIDEPGNDERAEPEPEEDDSWLYECSITAD